MDGPRIVAFSGYRVDCRERLLLRPDGSIARLPPQPFGLLLAFIARPRTLLTKEDLLRTVWAGRVVEENTLSRTLSTLRALLAGDLKTHQVIVTVSGVGYRLEGDVGTPVTSAAARAFPALDPTAVLADFGGADANAYDHLLRARASARMRGGPAMEEAITGLTRALAETPGFVAGWAGLSSLYMSQVLYGLRDMADVIEQAESAAVQVGKYVGDEWTARLCKANVCFMRRHWVEMHNQLVEGSVPAAAPWEVLVRRALLFGSVGLPKLSLSHAAELVLMDPLSTTSSCLYQIALLANGHFGACQAEYQRSECLRGDRGPIEYVRLMLAWALGQPESPVLRRLEASESFGLPVVTAIIPVCDRPGSAIAVLKRALVDGRHAGAYQQVIIGQWLARYGEPQSALEVLWAAYVERGFPNAALLWTPVLAEVRLLSRFAELIERVGIQDYWDRKHCQPARSLHVADTFKRPALPKPTRLAT